MLKRALDIILGLVVLIFSSPILTLVAIAIRLESKGPVFFVQERIGKNGVNFSVYKFRSMVENAENMGTGLFSYADDPRVTKVGNFIRRTSLDELPQIFNVLKGNMSLVGPRPIVTYEYGDYADFGPVLRKRFTVKPGITGLAQTTGRNENTWERKVELDNQYVDRLKKYGIWEDIKILIKTIFVVMSMKNTIEEKNEDG